MGEKLKIEGQYFQRFEWFLEPSKWWLRHLLFWSFRFSEYLVGLTGLADTDTTFWEFVFVFALPDFALVYFCLYVLIPFLLLKKRIFLFGVTVLTSVVIYSLYTFNAFIGLTAENLREHFTIYISFDFLDGIYLVGIASGLRIVSQFIRHQEKMAEIQNNKLETELAFLKSQVSPHFLFNTLNGIAVLSEKYPEKVTSVIVKLSRVLRYQIYEGERKSVLLRDEIEHLRNYLTLEGLRQSNAQIDFTVNGTAEYHSVAPMLFLPFVENAVKHGRDTRGNARISINFETSDDEIIFKISNDKPTAPVQHESGGVGLKNVKRRLELLYAGQYELDIKDDTDTYKVRLFLKMNAPKKLTT